MLGVHDDARGSVRLDGQELSGLDVRERIERGDRHGSRGSPGLGSRADDDGPAEHDVGASGCVVAWRVSLARARGTRGVGVGKPTSRQDAGARCADRCAQRRQSTEGRDRAQRHDPPARAADGRADARRGRRRQGARSSRRMRRLAADGMAVVFATSELAEMHAAADAHSSWRADASPPRSRGTR